ncbi:MAG: PAS domain-containing sensor histidine kinase [Promethearchaeia archaeon]
MSNNSSEMKFNLYNALIKTFPDMVVLLDLNGKILDLSENVISIYGVERKDECLGKTFFECIAPSDRELAMENFKRAVDEGYIKMVEYTFITKNGREFIGELSLSVVKNKEAKVVCLLGIIRDITNQKNIENELRESKKMLQLVMDNIPQYISWKDVNSGYLGCNRNFSRVAGLTDPTKIIGKTDYQLPWKISEAESFYEIDQLVMDTDKPEYHIIEPQQQADGRQAWLDTNKIPLHDSKGDVMGLLCTYEDITERVNAEMALIDSEKKYKQAYNRAEFYKDLFAHDISNILQNILSSLELSQIHLKNIEINSELKEIFKIIKYQIARGANLVSNVRKLSILDENESALHSVSTIVYLNKSINDIKKEFVEREINVELNTIFDEFYVKANSLLLDVFNNILFNAIKHNSNKTVNILIRTSEIMKNRKSYLKLEFIDNGLGIPDEQKKLIFQIDEQNKNIFSRLGLGLSLVKKIITTFDGSIWVEDKVKGDYKKGSNFIILLQKAVTK